MKTPKAKDFLRKSFFGSVTVEPKISKALLFAYAPISGISAWLSVLGADADGFAVFVIVIALTVLPLVLAILPIWARQEPRFSFYGTVALIGLLRGVLLWFLGQLFAITEQVNLSERLLVTLLATLIWLLPLAHVIEGNKRFQKRYSALENQVAFALAVRDPKRLANQIDEFSEIVQLKRTLGDVSAATLSKTLTKSDLLKASADIRAITDGLLGGIRDDHEASTTARTQSAGFLTAIVFALRKLEFRIFWVASAQFVISLLGSNALGNWESRLIFASAIAVPIVVFSSLAKLVQLKNVFQKAWVSIGLLLAIAGGTLLVVDMVFELIGKNAVFQPAGLLALISFASITAIILIDSLIATVDSNRAKILLQIEQHVALLNQDVRKRLAAYLHNSVQSKLTGLALQFDAIGASQAKTGFAIEQLSDLVTRSIGQDFVTQAENAVSELEQITSAWKGIADVQIAVDAGYKTNPLYYTAGTQIISEVITNSIRLGGATKIDVTSATDADSCVLSFQTNGSYQPTSQPRFGTAWINSIAVEEVIYEPTPSGLDITVRL